jgi:hypothetical protein
MTTTSARTTANLVLITAGIAAAYVIVTTPPLRRFAVRAIYAWLGASIPAYLLNEVRRAWVESDEEAGAHTERIARRGVEMA